MRGTVFPLTEHESKESFRQLTLLDTPDSDGPSGTPQWRTQIRHVTGFETRWFQEKGQHTGSGKSGASAYYANFTSVEDYGSDDEKVELVDAYQAHNDLADPGSDVGEEALDCDGGKENETFSSYCRHVGQRS